MEKKLVILVKDELQIKIWLSSKAKYSDVLYDLMEFS